VQNPDEPLATYVRKQLKHLQYMSETLAKSQGKICNSTLLLIAQFKLICLIKAAG
jgi:hypothetical protein